MSLSDSDNAIISIAVDAFVFNPAVCDGPNSRIAPITQPNYNYLSLEQEKVRADVLPQHELQYSLPKEINPRLVDIGSCTIRENRLGVYLHWVLPSVYRTGDTSASAFGEQRNATPTLTFRSVPDRWLVVRRIKSNTMVPRDASVPEIEGWIVESDRQAFPRPFTLSISADRILRLRDVSELKDDLDTQIDVSPYVSSQQKDKPPRHGRDFIGYKSSALGWKESVASRVDLTVMSSSNQLFADYQPHNGNVFSICDNFSYTVNGETKYLDSCDASYLVFGWHSDKSKDPLSSPIPVETTLRGFLKEKHIHLIEQDKTSIDPNDKIATLLWGAIHNVEWSIHKKPTTPAEEAAAQFQDPTKAPIAVGTGPLDALFTYIQTRSPCEQTELEKLILKVQTLLISQDDGVDDQEEAEDLLRNTDYDRFEGGVSWHLSGTDDTSNNRDEGSTNVLPSDDALDALRQANAIQAKLDTLLRTLPALRWELFTHWWKFLCDRGHGRNLETVKEEVTLLSSRLEKLLADTGPQSINELPTFIQKIIEEQVKLSCEPAAVDPFHQYQDATLLIAGLKSGWPKGHTKETKASLNVHLVVPALAAGTDPSEAQKLMDELLKVMPAKLKPETVEQLANAFLNIGDTGKNPGGQAEWTGQPWSPLFLEWEVEYYHIPYECWSMDRHQVSNLGTMEHIRWGIKPGVDVSTIPGVLGNMRKIDGRVLLLPQPGFSLASKVDQLFKNVPDAILDKQISRTERERLVSLLADSFPYMTSPLSGFTNHLLTVQQGTHINPNQRLPESDTPEPIQGAINLTKDKIRLGESQLRQVGDETAKTPYAIQVSGLPKVYAAFKPATHGQFRFTKLNIIDKFGQAISIIDQSPAVSPPPVYPCISEMYTVQPFGNGEVPNTVIRGRAREFIQIPPRINQPMRLNAHFMIKDTEVWRPVDDWENPIFGWLLINFANYGLQVFLPDGQFYREIRLGGASGATASDPWLPFSPPDPPPKVNPELDIFLAAMQDNRTYLEGVYKLILAAFKNMQDATDGYAEFISALLGKPVALTNIGFSLELDTPEKKDETVYPAGASRTPEKKVVQYELPLRIGDKNRVYDGLVGYYVPGQPEKIYTHYADGSPTEPIDIKTYPKLKPFFIDPKDTPAQDYITERAGKLLRMVALLDPFVAVHGYTGLSPIASIKLPNWTVESALKKMTAFFHLGPVIATKDVPEYDEKYKLTASYGGDVKPYPGKGLAIPAGLKKEDWIWLQPYGTGAAQESLEFMALNVEAAEEKGRWEPVPYTAVEGYLQLKRAVGGKPPAEENVQQGFGQIQ